MIYKYMNSRAILAHGQQLASFMMLIKDSVPKEVVQFCHFTTGLAVTPLLLLSYRLTVLLNALWIALSHQIEVTQSSAGSSKFIEHAAKCVLRNTLLDPMELFFQQTNCLCQVFKAYLLLVIRFIVVFALLIRLLLFPLFFLLLLLNRRSKFFFRLLVFSLSSLFFCDFLLSIFVYFCFFLCLLFCCILGGLDAFQTTQNFLNLRYLFFLITKHLLKFLIGLVEVVFHSSEDEVAIFKIKISHLVRRLTQNFFS